MSRPTVGNKLSDIERVIMRLEMAEENIRDLRKRQNTMETQWQEFAPAVAEHISTKVIIPAMVEGLMRSIKVSPALEMNGHRGNPLSLDDLASGVIAKYIERGKGFG